MDDQNPWSFAADIEEFHFYCCPECNVKDHSKEIFVQHILKQHPNAKRFLIINLLNVEIDIKKEEVDEEKVADFPSPDIKIETDIDISNTTNQDVINEDIKDIAKNEFYENPESNDMDNNEFYENPESEYLDEYESITDVPTETTNGEGKKSHLCTTCKKILSSASALKIHQKMVHEKVKELCNICGKSYSNVYNHKKQQHIRPKKYECQECNINFTTQQTLTRHIQRIHEGIPDDKKYACEQCGELYATAFQLKMHIKIIHDKVYDYKCERCNKSFGRKSHLALHIQTIHEKIKETCPYCGKSYDKNGLRRHIKDHEGQRNHTCHICSNSFKRGAHLRNHLQTIHKQV